VAHHSPSCESVSIGARPLHRDADDYAAMGLQARGAVAQSDRFRMREVSPHYLGFI